MPIGLQKNILTPRIYNFVMPYCDIQNFVHVCIDFFLGFTRRIIELNSLSPFDAVLWSINATVVQRFVKLWYAILPDVYLPPLIVY